MRSGAIIAAGPILAGLLLAPAAAEEISPAALTRLPEADVVILGEIHDNPGHHANQAAAVTALAPAALVFEMFGPEAALRVTPELRRSPAALARALGWAASGWPDFALYEPIFRAAPGAAIFGGALPRGTVRRAVAQGAAAAMGQGAALFGLDRPLPEAERAARIAGQDAAHCGALPTETLPGMVEAQRLRDAALARAVVAAMAETGGPVAVIAGNGHARTDWGVPRMLAQLLPGGTVLAVGQLEAPPDTPPPYDLWLVTAAAPRDDPCAALGD